MSDVVLRGARFLGSAALLDVLVRDGRVAAIAPVLDVPGVASVDLDGRWLMPGLWDAHVHLTQWALARRRLDVSAATSAAHAASLVAGRLASAPPPAGTALVGFGFRDGLWPDEPTSTLLDEVAGDVPVVLVSGDLHCGWVSTAGLRFLGVHAHPTGLLRESEWLPLSGVVDHVPDAVARRARARRHPHGGRPWRRRRRGLRDRRQPRRLAPSRRRSAPASSGSVPASGRTTSTGSCARTCTPATRVGFPLVDAGPAEGDHRRLPEHPHRVLPRPVPGHGLPRRPRRSRRTGWCRSWRTRPGTACGARSTRSATPRTTSRSMPSPPPGRRGRSSTPSSCRLGASRGSRSSASPRASSPSTRWTTGTSRTCTGPAGPDRSFRLADLHRAGVRLAFGSDAPVAPLDPWIALDAAVTRSRDGRPPWHPEQALDRRVALSSSVDGRGLVPSVGGPADLVVLDADPLTAPLRGLPVAGDARRRRLDAPDSVTMRAVVIESFGVVPTVRDVPVPRVSRRRRRPARHRHRRVPFRLARLAGARLGRHAPARAGPRAGRRGRRDGPAVTRLDRRRRGHRAVRLRLRHLRGLPRR